MKRRHLLPVLAGAPAAFSPSAAAQTAASFAITWRDIYARHWRHEKEYTLEVLEAMPPDGFDFKPNPVQRNFGDQLRHLAFANVRSFSNFKLVPIPSPPLAPDAKTLDAMVNATDKDAVRKFVAASFDYVSSVLEKLTEAELTATAYTITDPHTGTDVLLRAYTHTAHHRGQAIVYLRARNIAPPVWRFEPA